MQEILIEARGLGKRFGARWAVENVSLSLRAREVMTVIGPNGGGKTTLIRLLLGVLAPDAGEVRRKPGLRVGYVPQKLQIDPVFPLSVRGFLTLHAHRHDPDEASVRETARRVGVLPLLGARIQEVSGGEMQRVLLARALLCHPEVLVLDEPVQGVDVAGQSQLYALIAEVARERGLAVLMVSHDLHLVMAATDEVICLNGHVCCAGHPHSVRQDPAFSALFGPGGAESLAVYTHHHNHEH